MKTRYDKAYIQDFSETSEGYLTITTCPITRPGVFPYMGDSGEIQMEAKLPDDLFSEKTIQSAIAKPITDDHPTELVTASNYQKYAKGMTHTDAAVRDNKLAISFTITDAATIKKIQAGKRELSIGFSADVQKETGSYGGAKYDAIQRNMEINHIAIVDQGRAGPTVAIRGDSAAFMVEGNQKHTGGENMATIKIDSKDYEVDSVVKARIDALDAQVEVNKDKAAQLDKVTGERDALQTKNTQLEKDLAEEKEKAPTLDSLDQMVTDRMELVAKAHTFIGDSFESAKKTDRAIKEEVILSVNKDFKGDGKSDDYVDAFFDALTAGKQEFTQAANFHDASDKKKEEEELEELRKKRLNMNKKGDK